MSEAVYGESFDPSQASAEEIRRRANRMRGKTLGELGVTLAAVKDRPYSDKGVVGLMVERYFGIKQNSDSAPDFTAAGIELKVVPLQQLRPPKAALRVKERTSVTMINYGRLVDESWKSASVRKKVAAVLFVFYHHTASGDPLTYPIKDVVLWEPSAELMLQFESDWTVVREKVAAGLAHQISERDGKLLGAATKGAGGTFVDQPRSPIKAKPRAWALKPSLTTWILQDASAKRSADESLAETLKLSPGQDFERAVLVRLRGYAGQSLETIASGLGVELSSEAKAGPAILIRRLLGMVNDKARIREFEQFGIGVKTVPISEDGQTVFESMSFPRFDHMEVIDETWEESELRNHLQRILFVPLVRRGRKEPRAKHRLGRAFFWSPSEEELDAIGVEWETFVQMIREKEADRLPSAAQTEYIHVRPKGRDGSDTEPAPGFAAMMKRCFWLNDSYVRRIINENLPDGVLPTAK